MTLTPGWSMWGLQVSRTVGAAVWWEEGDPDGLTRSSLDSHFHWPDAVGTGVSLSSSGCRAGAKTAKEGSQPAESQTYFPPPKTRVGILCSYKPLSNYLYVNNEGWTCPVSLPPSTKLSSSICCIRNTEYQIQCSTLCIWLSMLLGKP